MNKEWISVKDRLPKDYKDVLVANYNFVSVGWNSIADDKQWHIRAVVFEGEVLFWMPLPDPPEEK